MPKTSVTIFDLEAGNDVTVVLQGAQARAQASAVSASQQSNSVAVSLTGASASAIPGAIGVVTGTPGVFNPDFPRMCGVRVGRRSWGDNPSGSGNNFEAEADEVEALASYHFSIINGQQGQGQGYVAAVADWIVRSTAVNADHIRYSYTDLQETGTSGDVYNKCISETGPTGNGGTWLPNDWLCRDTSGNTLSNFGTLPLTNVTKYVTRDSSNLIFPEWYADYISNRDFDPHNGNGIKIHVWNDVTDHKIRRNDTDYNRNGVDDNQKSNWNVPGSEGQASAAAYREGHAIFADRMRVNQPGILVTCNATTWSTEYTSPNPDDAPPIHSFYEGRFNGGLNEGQTIAAPSQATFAGVWADGTVNTNFGSWRLAQNNYLYLMRHMQAPKHVADQYGVIISPDSLYPIVGTHITSTVMGLARWAICSWSMDDGYGYVTNENRQYNTSPHWDEFGTVVTNQAVTGLTKGWLGQPVDAAQSVKEDISKQSSVWLGSDNNGIFKREFDNGIVLVNSSRTNSITIPVLVGADESNGELESGKWKRITGFQDPNHNNGQVVTNNLTIPPINGFMLERV